MVSEVVSVVHVPTTKTAVLLLCTCGARLGFCLCWPRARAFCGGLCCLLAWCGGCCFRCGVGVIWQMEMYSWNRSHQRGFTVAANFQWSSSRDWCRFHGSQTMTFRKVVSQRRSSTLRCNTTHNFFLTHSNLLLTTIDYEKHATYPGWEENATRYAPRGSTVVQLETHKKNNSAEHASWLR